MEGIPTCTTYKTQKYIEEYYPALVVNVDDITQSLFNHQITDYEKSYEHSFFTPDLINIFSHIELIYRKQEDYNGTI